MWLLTLIRRMYTGSVRIILTDYVLRSHFVYIVRKKIILSRTAIFSLLSLERKNEFLLRTRYSIEMIRRSATWELTDRELWKIFPRSPDRYKIAVSIFWHRLKFVVRRWRRGWWLRGINFLLAVRDRYLASREYYAAELREWNVGLGPPRGTA